MYMQQLHLLDASAGRQFVLAVPVRVDSTRIYYHLWNGNGWADRWEDAAFYDSDTAAEIAQRDAIQNTGPLVACMLRQAQAAPAPGLSERHGVVYISRPVAAQPRRNRRALHNILGDK
jgi:hypothetical protein